MTLFRSLADYVILLIPVKVIYGTLYINVPVQKLIYISSVKTQDVVLKTRQERLMMETDWASERASEQEREREREGGEERERESGKSVLWTRLDDDDDLLSHWVFVSF